MEGADAAMTAAGDFRVLAGGGEHRLGAEDEDEDEDGECELGPRWVELCGSGTDGGAAVVGGLALGVGGGRLARLAARRRPRAEGGATLAVAGGAWALRDCDVVSHGGTALCVGASARVPFPPSLPRTRDAPRPSPVLSGHVSSLPPY